MLKEALPAFEANGTELLADYRPPPGIFDEMMAGGIRPHCRRFIEEMEAIGRGDLPRRWDQARRLIRENGAVYNALGEGDNASRPWDLDPFPLLLPAEEWRHLSEGLAQRCQLLEMILADCHGPQKLLANGMLPAELLFSHPGFVRPFHGQAGHDSRYLHLYAADLARAPDGRWWVVGDRTDAPLGLGYALESRLVTSRTLPNVIHECKVERLATFFMAIRETLQQLARSHRENPRIVMLTQGPSGPSYFEDAYLARYLGYTLVEGGDLAVRDQRVMMKTLGGLVPVDVIWRRQSDVVCDPLEVRSDRSLGVPGLVQAVRQGEVVVVNALGSSLVESPAFNPFLPGLARKLLGEDLKLPSLATWWCGERGACDYAIDHLDRLVIRAAFRLGRRENPNPANFAHETYEEIVRRIRAHPTSFVAQEEVIRSSAPTWTDAGPQPQRVALRAYVLAHKGSYLVLPGGLARIAEDSRELDRSIVTGSGSKDAWVLADGPIRDVTLLQSPAQSIQLRRSGAELPSRVADNLFWLGRYVERAEGAARLLRPILVRLTSESDAAATPEIQLFFHMLAVQGQIEPGYVVEGMRDQLPAIERNLPRAVLDESQPGSLRFTIATLVRIASRVRDRMSIDSWRLIHRLDEPMTSLSLRRRVDLSDVLDMLNTMVLHLSAYSGLVNESMTRTPAWRFLDLGRRLERSLNVISLVQNVLLNGQPNAATLEAVLEVADSVMTYRSRYLANLQLPMVLDLILTDDTNPRALVFQLVQMQDHVRNLPRDENLSLPAPEERIALAAVNSLRLVQLQTLCDASQGMKLRQLLNRLNRQLPRLSDLISHKYLIHADAPRSFPGPRTTSTF